jgi:hypothetical protein
MKFLISIVTFCAVTTFANSAAAESVATKDVNLTVSDVYIPGGFSQNTDAYVIVSGMFPNSCYKWNKAEVTSPTPLIQEVKATATVAQSICLMVMVPYQEEVNLGRLVSGTHTLRFLNGDGTSFEKTLTVE